MQAVRPGMLWDLGCNDGHYTELSLQAGAGYAVGFDFDQGALELCFDRARRGGLALQSVFLDAANASPDQGWNGQERKSLESRRNADAVMALAFVHHLAIGRYVPLDQLVDWIVAMAPTGLIEFVPKSDPMAQRLLQFRDDGDKGYDEEAFVARLADRARIVRRETVSDTGRQLFWFDRSEAA